MWKHAAHLILSLTRFRQSIALPTSTTVHLWTNSMSWDVLGTEKEVKNAVSEEKWMFFRNVTRLLNGAGLWSNEDQAYVATVRLENREKRATKCVSLVTGFKMAEIWRPLCPACHYESWFLLAEQEESKVRHLSTTLPFFYQYHWLRYCHLCLWEGHKN